jgi:hypothetical protein
LTQKKRIKPKTQGLTLIRIGPFLSGLLISATGLVAAIVVLLLFLVVSHEPAMAHPDLKMGGMM